MGGASPQKEAQMLYEKFGEFDSAEEINAAADGQKAEGDTDAILRSHRKTVWTGRMRRTSLTA